MMQKKILWISAIFMMSVFSLPSTLAAQEVSEEPYVILVEYTVNAAHVDEAVDLLSEMQLQTLENEEGCLIYDVLLGIEDNTKIFIYESYQNEAAFKAHTNSKYFKEIVPVKLKPLIKQEKITRVSPLNFNAGEADAEM